MQARRIVCTVMHTQKPTRIVIRLKEDGTALNVAAYEIEYGDH
jgi:hypothetical protein